MYYKVIVDKKGAKLICGQCFANFHQCQHLLDKKKFFLNRRNIWRDYFTIKPFLI